MKIELKDESGVIEVVFEITENISVSTGPLDEQGIKKLAYDLEELTMGLWSVKE